MKNMFTQFATDADLETKGIWLDYGSFRVRVARAGGSNKKYILYAESKTRPMRHALKANAVTDERAKELLFDVYAKTIVLGWQVAAGTNPDGSTIWKDGIHNRDGSTAEFNAENVIAVFRQLPELFTDIQDQCSNISLFRQEELGEEAKN